MKLNRLIFQLLCSMLLAVTTVSCVASKDSLIVHENTGTGTNSYRETEGSGVDSGKTAGAGRDGGAAALAKRLQAPERYVFSMQSEDGTFQLNCDADIILPDTARIPVYKVERKPIDRKWIDCVTNAFFGNAPVYDGNSYLPDPGIYGNDTENPMEKVEVTPWPEEMDMASRSSEYFPFYFYGIVEMGEALYSYDLHQTFGEGLQIDVLRKKPEALNETLHWDSGYYDSEETTSNGRPSKEEAESIAGITPEQAEEIVKEYLRKLGLDDFSPKYTCLGVCFYTPGSDYGFDANQYLHAGYLVSCTRDIRGIPVTDEAQNGSSMETGLDDMERWGYEQVEFFINREGLQEARLHNMYSIGEQQAEDVELMSFPEIAELFEQVAEMQNEKTDAHHVQVTVDRVQLGYMRIYNPGADPASGLLVPAWDFFGSREYENAGAVIKRAEPNQSILTINASDGTVIDRQLGY